MIKRLPLRAKPEQVVAKINEITELLNKQPKPHANLGNSNARKNKKGTGLKKIINIRFDEDQYDKYCKVSAKEGYVSVADWIRDTLDFMVED